MPSGRATASDGRNRLKATVSVHVVRERQRAALDEAAHRIVRDRCGTGFVGRNGDVKVTPVDAQIVARPVENALVLCADRKHLRGRRLVPREGHGLAGIAGGEIGPGGQEHIDPVLGGVRRVRRPREIGDRARQDIEIVKKGRREKREVKADARARKGVSGVGRGQRHRGLGQRGNVAWIAAHDAEGLTVDADQPIQRLGMAGPVTRVAAC